MTTIPKLITLFLVDGDYHGRTTELNNYFVNNDSFMAIIPLVTYATSIIILTLIKLKDR